MSARADVRQPLTSQYRTLQFWMDPVGQRYDVPPTSTHEEIARGILGADPRQSSSPGARLTELGWIRGSGPMSGELRVQVNSLDNDSKFLIDTMIQDSGARLIIVDTSTGTAVMQSRDFLATDPSNVESASRWTKRYLAKTSHSQREMLLDAIGHLDVDAASLTTPQLEVVYLNRAFASGEVDGQVELGRGAQTGSWVVHVRQDQADLAKQIIDYTVRMLGIPARPVVIDYSGMPVAAVLWTMRAAIRGDEWILPGGKRIYAGKKTHAQVAAQYMKQKTLFFRMGG